MDKILFLAKQEGYGDHFKHLLPVVEMWHIVRGCLAKILYMEPFNKHIFLPFYRKYTKNTTATFPIEKYMTFENADLFCAFFEEAWLEVRALYMDDFT